MASSLSFGDSQNHNQGKTPTELTPGKVISEPRIENAKFDNIENKRTTQERHKTMRKFTPSEFVSSTSSPRVSRVTTSEPALR